MTAVAHGLETVAAVLAAATPQKDPKINWGSMPDWLAATGALLNLVFLGVALLREIRLRRAEEGRRDRERRDLEARHARRVSVTVREGSGLRLSLEVANDGDGPIFDVVPGLDGAQVRTPITIRRIGAGQTANAEVGSASVLRDDSGVVPTVTFTDVDGLRWACMSGRPPIRQLTP
ncbi:hypothetical protein [Catenuloplanes japonicus]|uniref:hypothetical protein n=1 Tax=Catenuloplanes japonicus TaxID=33876 RepID=UPI000524F682|nr:hypothetical protein [Catenuloplanes japonicus]